MATNVVMPQMGESIAEGTIVRWIKKLGDQVDRDEPLFEISTDKVDAEIPSPAAGVLSDIRVKEGETVAIKTVRKELIEEEDRAGMALARFKNEARAAGRLSHTGIVAVYDYGESGSVAYIEAVFAHRFSYASAMALTALTVFTLAAIVVSLVRERHGVEFGADAAS